MASELPSLPDMPSLPDVPSYPLRFDSESEERGFYVFAAVVRSTSSLSKDDLLLGLMNFHLSGSKPIDAHRLLAATEDSVATTFKFDLYEDVEIMPAVTKSRKSAVKSAAARELQLRLNELGKAVARADVRSGRDALLGSFADSVFRKDEDAEAIVAKLSKELPNSMNSKTTARSLTYDFFVRFFKTVPVLMPSETDELLERLRTAKINVDFFALSSDPHGAARAWVSQARARAKSV